MPYKDKAKNREYQRQWAQKKREADRSKAREARNRPRDRNKRYVASVKESTPCADCGESYPAFVMDFNHVDGEKVMEISKMVNWYGLKRIKEELEKREVVCANCHRFRTHTGVTFWNVAVSKAVRAGSTPATPATTMTVWLT